MPGAPPLLPGGGQKLVGKRLLRRRVRGDQRRAGGGHHQRGDDERGNPWEPGQCARYVNLGSLVGPAKRLTGRDVEGIRETGHVELADMEGPAVKRFLAGPSIPRSMLTSEDPRGGLGRLPERAGSWLTMGRLRRRIRLICADCPGG